MSDPQKTFILEVQSFDGVKTYYISKPSFLLGRGSTSEVKLDDKDISREHIRIFFSDALKVEDMDSSNGTFINGIKIPAKTHVDILEKDKIVLGHSKITLRVKLMTPSEEAQKIAKMQDDQKDSPVQVAISGFPDNANEFKMDFKNVTIDLPKYKDPSQHAQEIIKEAEFVKYTIIKGANVQKEKVIAEAKLQSKKIAEATYQEYQSRVNLLIQQTREQMNHLKAETESHLDDKRLHAMDEIQNMWKEHQDQLQSEKNVIMSKLDAENKMKLDIEVEKLRNEMFIEKNRVISEAESDIMAKTKAYRSQFENERTEHSEKVRFLTKQFDEMKTESESLEKKIAEYKESTNEKSLEYDNILSKLNIEKDKLEALQKIHKNIVEENSKIQENLNGYQKNRDAALEIERQTRKNIEELTKRIQSLSEQKQSTEEQLQNMEKNLSDAKLKVKSEVDQEYKSLRDAEGKKFEEFKVAELKELQKIREEHTSSIKKLSLELSQEIATKLEMQNKKNPNQGFDFEKYLDVINSVIQVKTSNEGGLSSNHQLQLENWKRKQKTDKVSIFAAGVAASVLILVSGNYIYSKFTRDSFKDEMTRTAELRKQKEIENKFIPEKTSVYYESYVDATLYTESYADVFLNDKNQAAWVTKATLYFLNTWKLDEQKTIQVISNSRSLVQSISEKATTLTKTNFKTELEKLKVIESTNVAQQSEILGSNVRFEAYKKLERQFFSDLLKKRGLATDGK
jgi:pSer/pThr/pTyr-binding forkhead associated (FHA) protein